MHSKQVHLNEATTVQFDTLISNARLHDREGLWYVGLLDGRFAFVGLSCSDAAVHTLDASGKLLLPGLLEPHTHIDKTYSWQDPGAGQPQEPEALRQAISNMRKIKAGRAPAVVVAAARRAFDRAVSFGVSHLRSHLDLGDAQDLANIRHLLELREEYRAKIRIEYTALGGTDTAEQRALMRAALTAGVDCVGGAPALTPNPLQAVAGAIALAEEFGKPLDLHIDETENPESPCLETLADLVHARRFPLPVLASHCCSLAFVSPRNRSRILDKVRAAGIHLVALPACNLVLMGRKHPSPKPRGSLPVDELLRENIRVCAGTDNVGDPFQPWGDYDPLRSAALCAEVAQIDVPAVAFSLISTAPAAAFWLTDYGIASGNRADCSLLETDNLRTALAESPLRSHVFFAGKLVLQQHLQQTWN